MIFYRISSIQEQDSLFVKAFALYKSSFPIYEQRLIEKQTALMTNPLYHFNIIMKGDTLIGILLYWEISFYTYIEHFAIHPAIRGKALGSMALKLFFKEHPFVILEIDPPISEVSIRREHFYQRLGFHKNVYAHKHPAYQKQFQPHELVVMSYPKCMTEKEYQLFRQELSEIVMRDMD